MSGQLSRPVVRRCMETRARLSTRSRRLAVAQAYGGPRRMREPRRDHDIAPTTGEDSRAALDAAIESLGKLRGLEWVVTDVTLHLLASLITEARSRLPRAVADARDQDYSFGQAADLLGVTRASAGSVTPAARSGKDPPEAD